MSGGPSDPVMIVQSYLEIPTHPADGGGSAGYRSVQAVPPPQPSRLAQAPLLTQSLVIDQPLQTPTPAPATLQPTMHIHLQNHFQYHH